MISAKTARIRRSRWFSIAILPLSVFPDVYTDLQLAEYYFRDFFCKTEKEPEPVITEDLKVLALSLMNNTRFKSEK